MEDISPDMVRDTGFPRKAGRLLVVVAAFDAENAGAGLDTGPCCVSPAPARASVPIPILGSMVCNFPPEVVEDKLLLAMEKEEVGRRKVNWSMSFRFWLEGIVATTVAAEPGFFPSSGFPSKLMMQDLSDTIHTKEDSKNPASNKMYHRGERIRPKKKPADRPTACNSLNAAKAPSFLRKKTFRKIEYRPVFRQESPMPKKNADTKDSPKRVESSSSSAAPNAVERPHAQNPNP